MKTHYEVRDEGRTYQFAGVGGKEAALNYRSRTANPTLWQVERESDEEAAVRRMGWLEKELRDGKSFQFESFGVSFAEYVDKHCPPPAPKETQLDWNTGEPIETIEAKRSPSGLWFAFSMSHNEWLKLDDSESFYAVNGGRAATGPTQQAAIANLRAIRASLKSQTK
jgi:hypothetical protein